MNILDEYLIGILVFIVSIFIARQIGDNALKKLDPEKKLQLIELFSSGNKTLNYIFLIGTLLGYFAIIRFGIIDSQIAFIGFILLMLGYIIVANVKAYRKLKVNDFPEAYIRSYLTSTTVRIIGMLVFFGLMINKV